MKFTTRGLWLLVLSAVVVAGKAIHQDEEHRETPRNLVVKKEGSYVTYDEVIAKKQSKAKGGSVTYEEVMGSKKSGSGSSKGFKGIKRDFVYYDEIPKGSGSTKGKSKKGGSNKALKKGSKSSKDSSSSSSSSSKGAKGAKKGTGGGFFRPVASPTPYPTSYDSPTATRFPDPTMAPVVAPTDAPVVAPTDAPVAITDAPTDAPVSVETGAPKNPLQSIVEIAAETDFLSILVELLSDEGQADLLLALLGEGPYTVFAPTNSAFEELFQTLDFDLLDSRAITFFLAYHVFANGALTSSDLQNGIITALNGDGILVDTTDGVVLNGDVNVIIPDVIASNGVVHVIDSVLLPPVQTVAEILEEGEFSVLISLLVETGLLEVLTSPDQEAFTLFAPTNAAFFALGDATIDALRSDLPTLTNVLLYHVSPGIVGSGDLARIPNLPTLLTNNFIMVGGGGTVLNSVTGFEDVDNLARDGVVHVIDSVLIPPTMGDPQ